MSKNQSYTDRRQKRQKERDRQQNTKQCWKKKKVKVKINRIYKGKTRKKTDKRKKK